MNAKNFFYFFFFIICFFAAFGMTAHASSVDPSIIEDVRWMEKKVAGLFGYDAWPLAPTEVVYNTNCRSAVSSHSNGTTMFPCDISKYRERKVFLTKNTLGEMEAFPGYVDYWDNVAHEVGHSFSRLFISLKDRHWAKCDADEYLELTEGFATYVAYEVLLREAKFKNNHEYERYLAVRTAKYLVQFSMENPTKYPSEVRGLFGAIAFSLESKRHIKLHMERFPSRKQVTLKDEDMVDPYYPRGLMRVYALKHIFTKNGFENGTIKEHFCK